MNKKERARAAYDTVQERACVLSIQSYAGFAVTATWTRHVENDCFRPPSEWKRRGALSTNIYVQRPATPAAIRAWSERTSAKRDKTRPPDPVAESPNKITGRSGSLLHNECRPTRLRGTPWEMGSVASLMIIRGPFEERARLKYAIFQVFSPPSVVTRCRDDSLIFVTNEIILQL